MLWTKYESNFWLYNRTWVAIWGVLLIGSAIYDGIWAILCANRDGDDDDDDDTKIRVSKSVHNSEHWIWGILIKCIRSFGRSFIRWQFNECRLFQCTWYGFYWTIYSRICVFVLMNYFQPMNHHHSNYHSKWTCFQRKNKLMYRFSGPKLLLFKSQQ